MRAMDRLVDRLQARAAQSFVGRQAELSLIEASLAGEGQGAAVFVVHGPGGVGKTSLLEQARRIARTRGTPSVRLDARDVEPTPLGFLRALGMALELAPADCTLGRVLERWSAQPRRLLVLDTFERLGHLEGWLRRTLLPELPGDTRVILATRTLDESWRTDPLWREGARVLTLGNLDPVHCERHLFARGVPDVHHEGIVRLSRGHPLALTLLADTALATGEVPQALGSDLVRQLAARFTAHAESALHRRALEVCAHARVTSEALIAAAVDRTQAHALFEWLAGLSFVEAGPEGLFPHDLVRDAIDDELHWRDSERYRALHVAVRSFLIEHARASMSEAAGSTFDILFLHRRSPVMRPFVDFGALGSMMFERAGPQDLHLLRALAASELPPSQQAAVEHWFLHPATSAWAVRPVPGELAGATLSIDLAALNEAERAGDPLLAATWAGLQRAGIPHPGDRLLVARWNIAAGGTQQPSAAMNALQMAQFYQWLTEPRLGAFVICVDHPDFWVPMMRHIDFDRLPGCELELDGIPYGCFAHDWRRLPAEEWLALMAEREIGAPPEAAIEMPAGPQPLARAEFERAVRDALRAYGQREALRTNPLACCPVVARAAGAGEDAAATLQRLLLEAAQGLRERPRDQKFWRALELTYFRPAGSQELAAERLGLPFGTYRYQLATGVERVVDALWSRQGH
jgi:hypothetical protein